MVRTESRTGPSEVLGGPAGSAAGRRRSVWPPAPLPGVEAIILAQVELPFDQRTAHPAYLSIAEAAGARSLLRAHGPPCGSRWRSTSDRDGGTGPPRTRRSSELVVAVRTCGRRQQRALRRQGARAVPPRRAQRACGGHDRASREAGAQQKAPSSVAVRCPPPSITLDVTRSQPALAPS